MGRIAEHVYVEQLGHVPAPEHRVLLPEAVPDLGALLLHQRPLLSRRLATSDVPDQVAQSVWYRHAVCLFIYKCCESFAIIKTFLNNIKHFIIDICSFLVLLIFLKS